VRPLDVGIVGSGTGGPAAALFLARAGHRVTLYERVKEPSPVGAGIVLQPIGQAVLAALGLRDEVVARGSPIEILNIETLGGRKIARLDYAYVGEGIRGYGMHRGALFSALMQAVRRDRVELRLGVDVVKLAAARGDRPVLVAADGARHGPHDLVVVADGARSRLRDATSGILAKSVRAYAWGALWFIGQDVDGRFAGALHQVANGTRRMAGMLPSGLGPDPANTTPLVTVYWSFRADGLGAFRAAPLESWKEEFLGYFPDAAPVVGQITTHDDLLFATYQDVVMPRWHTHNVVYLGDAAHAMSPQLGQGCNLALFDAMVLARCLGSGENLPAALARYTAERREHLSFYQRATRWLTPFFQSDYPLLGWARDTLMSLAAKVPFFHREMVLAMCGAKQGFLWPRGGVIEMTPALMR
jgi:2-polyprenyl-6-methoxyphenol hydroxylase-like FAD-dependent oxidoreductase